MEVCDMRKFMFAVLFFIIILTGCVYHEPRQSTNVSLRSESSPIPIQTNTPNPFDKLEQWKEGQYKVGYDIKAGEYYLAAYVNQSAYFSISSDANGDNILMNDNFKNNSIITIDNGQYLEINSCVMYKFSDLGRAKLIDGYYDEGMYKVGVQIPQGEYKAIATNGMGYYAIYQNSNQMEIDSNDNFKGEKYVEVKNGQYLKLVRAKLKPPTQ